MDASEPSHQREIFRKILKNWNFKNTGYNRPNISFPTIPAAIEFKCGDCFKKAYIYEEVGIEVDLINGVVYPDTEDIPIVVEVYSDGKIVDKQFMNFIEISLDSFCTGEFEVVRLDHHAPIDVGKSDYGIELDCGTVCKKILNIEDIFPDENNCNCCSKKRDEIVSVFPPFEELLLVKAFTGGKVFEKQGVGQLFTLKSRVCSQEENVIQINHVNHSE